MTDSPEQPSDEELSELIDDEEKNVDDETEQNEGGVEVGIPPAINDEEGVDSTEESFSMDDFESTDVVENPIEETVTPEATKDSVSEESTVSYEEKVESQESDQMKKQFLRLMGREEEFQNLEKHFQIFQGSSRLTD